MLQKQVILSTEPASFLRFHIYGKSTAVVKKKKYWSVSKVILGIKKKFQNILSNGF